MVFKNKENILMVALDNIDEYYKIPGAIQTGKETTVDVEHLIMKIAMVEQIILLQSRIGYIYENEDELIQPLDEWAVSGMIESLSEVSHALECGLYGYDKKRIRGFCL
jgi:hypothetical protein